MVHAIGSGSPIRFGSAFLVDARQLEPHKEQALYEALDDNFAMYDGDSPRTNHVKPLTDAARLVQASSTAGSTSKYPDFYFAQIEGPRDDEFVRTVKAQGARVLNIEPYTFGDKSTDVPVRAGSQLGPLVDLLLWDTRRTEAMVEALTRIKKFIIPPTNPNDLPDWLQ